MPKKQFDISYGDLYKMIFKTIIIYFSLLATLVFSQEIEKFSYPRDTTYTLQIAYNKYKKDYPFINPIYYDTVNGYLQHKNISYKSTASRPLSLDIFTKAEEPESPKPAVILIHGGGWSSGDKSLMYPLADYLAKHGFIAIPIEYRLSPEAKYPAGVDDIKDGVAWIIEHSREYNIDLNKIVISGCSAGAHLAGLVGLSYGINQNESSSSRVINAIINIDGIMDFTAEKALEDSPNRKLTASERWFGRPYYENPEPWNEATPLYYVNEFSPPILFINSSQPRFHNGRDETIEKLNEFSIYSEVHTFDDAPHSFWLFDPWFERTGSYAVNFLKKVLNQHK